MKVMEAQRTRHLVLRLDRGDELPAALQRALDEAGAQSAWIQGFGTLEAAEVAVFDARLRSYGKGRRLEPGGDVVSLGGNVSQIDGSPCVRLFATLARESDTGLALAAGELLWARAFSLELHVTVFEDGALARVTDERSGMLALVRSSAAGGGGASSGGGGGSASSGGGGGGGGSTSSGSSDARPRPAPMSDSGPPARSAGPVTKQSESGSSALEPGRGGMGSNSEAPQHLSPPRREKPIEDPSEVYPEVGDIATHFHFGECKIISSDGDKIRLQQLKDLRVREVALSALKTELVHHDVETNHRHFRLVRKN